MWAISHRDIARCTLFLIATFVIFSFNLSLVLNRSQENLLFGWIERVLQGNWGFRPDSKAMNVETKKMEHEKKEAQLRKLEMKRGSYGKMEKTKKEVEKLESQIMVSSHAIETTSAEIIKIKGYRALPSTH